MPVFGLLKQIAACLHADPRLFTILFTYSQAHSSTLLDVTPLVSNNHLPQVHLKAPRRPPVLPLVHSCRLPGKPPANITFGTQLQAPRHAPHLCYLWRAHLQAPRHAPGQDPLCAHSHAALAVSGSVATAGRQNVRAHCATA